MSQLPVKPGIGHNAAPSLNIERAPLAEADYNDGLLAVAGPIMMAAYAGAAAIASFSFFGNGDALFAVVISIGFGVMYFTVPLLMGRVRNSRDQRWQGDSSHKADAMVDLWTGRVHRWEGIVQIVSVPLAVLFGFAAFAVIWSLTA